MKYISCLIICIVLICTISISCTKENSTATNDLPDYIEEVLGMPPVLSSGEDASILIKSNESLNSPSGNVFLTSGAYFKDDGNKNIDAGDLSIFNVFIFMPLN